MITREIATSQCDNCGLWMTGTLHFSYGAPVFFECILCDSESLRETYYEEEVQNRSSCRESLKSCAAIQSSIRAKK